MTRSVRLAIGLCLFLASPLMVVLKIGAEAETPVSGCHGGTLGCGMNLTTDFTPVFVAVGVALVGVAFIVSMFFGRDDAALSRDS